MAFTNPTKWRNDMKRILIADAIIKNDQSEIAVIRRNFWPEGKLDLPGGFADEGESAEQAAIREAKEECGLDVAVVRKLGVYDYADRGEKQMHVFIMKILGGELKGSQEGETQWLNPKDIKPSDLAFPQVHAKVLADFLELNKLLI